MTGDPSDVRLQIINSPGLADTNVESSVGLKRAA